MNPILKTALFILFIFAFAACNLTPTPEPATPTPIVDEIPAEETLAQFVDQLTLALINQDYTQLQTLMGESMPVGFWQSEGVEWTPSQAIEQLRDNYLGPAPAIGFDKTTDLTALLGIDPLIIWGPHVDAKQGLFVQGLSRTGQTEAIFIVAQSEDGFYWHSMLIAPGGFQPPVSVTETPTNVATATPEPHTPTATTPAGPTAERVRFGAGETSAMRNGSFNAGGGFKQFVLNVGRGQVMDVIASSGPIPVTLRITSPSELQWLGDAFGFDSAVAVKTIALPESGDYLSTLTTPNAAPASDFQVTFTVITPSSEGAGAERVRFAPGGTSATRRGALTPGGSKRYLLGAAAGQTMNVHATARSVPVRFTITTPGGTIIEAEQFGSEVFIFGKTLVLPENGDYLITLTTPLDAEPTIYDIDFSIEGSSGVSRPERIEFAPGATAATVTGNISAPNRDEYILRASASQIMYVEITSPDGLANFSIVGQDDGQPYKRLVNEDHSFEFTLPATQDYLINIARPEGTSTYSLYVQIN
ncbi:hypothetical protein KFU94_62435 [Chloroflexi bacterium TSY]|nr:hypothetical protein [Chloroflexi bacterium TSY]